MLVGIVVGIIAIIIFTVLNNKGGVGGGTTFVLDGSNDDPSFRREFIEIKDGAILVQVKYPQSGDKSTYNISGSFQREGDLLNVYAESSFLGSQGVQVKIGWVTSDGKMYFSNKELVPYHNKYTKEFFDGERANFGSEYCDKQIVEQRTQEKEQLVAYADAKRNGVYLTNGTEIATFNGNAMEVGGAIIALFFEGWPPLGENQKELCRFWVSGMVRH